MVLLLELAPAQVVETGLIALALASVFAIGSWLRPFDKLGFSARTLVSFCAGMSAAYVFVHVLPELAEARALIAHLESIPRPFEGRMVYFVGLLGFLAAYGLDRLYHPAAAGSASARRALIRHVGGFAVYVSLVAYLLVNDLDGVPHTLFAVAMAAHFLAINRTLRDEYGAGYTWPFQAALSAAVLIGWAVGISAVVPQSAIALLLAFVSGAVIMSSAVSELPAEREGRLDAFIAGGLVFGAILLLAE